MLARKLVGSREIVEIFRNHALAKAPQPLSDEPAECAKIEWRIRKDLGRCDDISMYGFNAIEIGRERCEFANAARDDRRVARVVTTDLGRDRFLGWLSRQQAQAKVVATPFVDQRRGDQTGESAAIHHYDRAANCESFERHSRGGKHNVVIPEASVKIINLASEGAADLVEFETRLLGGRTNGCNVSGVLGKEQASSRSGRQRRTWREEVEIDGIREKFYLFLFASQFRD